MPNFASGGHKIAYDDLGDGDPIVLLHGFAGDKAVNWRLPGWYRLLRNAGFRVIAPDARGHGQSDKPLAPEAYAPEGIAGDVIRLLDHLHIESADLFGYSMGGRNVAWLLTAYPDRIRSAVIGGAGLNVLAAADARRWEKKGYKLTADNKNTDSLAVPSLVPLYRGVTKLGGRAGALSACLLGSFPSLPAKALAKVDVPTLVIAGSRDTVAGSPVPLAAAMQNAKAVVVPGKTHLSIIGDAFFKGAVMGFLGNRAD